MQVIVRMNGGKHKNDEEIKVELEDGMGFKHLVKTAFKKFSLKDDYHKAKVFNKDGVMLLENDISFLSSGEILYLSPKGKLGLLLCRRKLQFLRHPR